MSDVDELIRMSEEQINTINANIEKIEHNILVLKGSNKLVEAEKIQEGLDKLISARDQLIQSVESLRQKKKE